MANVTWFQIAFFMQCYHNKLLPSLSASKEWLFITTLLEYHAIILHHPRLALHATLSCLIFKNSYSDSSGTPSVSLFSPTTAATLPPLTLWHSDLNLLWTISTGQPFRLDAALVNKLVLCAWLSRGDLEVSDTITKYRFKSIHNNVRETSL